MALIDRSANKELSSLGAWWKGLGKMVGGIFNGLINIPAGIIMGITGLNTEDVYLIQKAPYTEWANLWGRKIKERNQNRSWWKQIGAGIFYGVAGLFSGAWTSFTDILAGAFQTVVGGARMVKWLEGTGLPDNLIKIAMLSGHPVGFVFAALWNKFRYGLAGVENVVIKMNEQLSKYKSIGGELQKAINENPAWKQLTEKAKQLQSIGDKAVDPKKLVGDKRVQQAKGFASNLFGGLQNQAKANLANVAGQVNKVKGRASGLMQDAARAKEGVAQAVARTKTQAQKQVQQGLDKGLAKGKTIQSQVNSNVANLNKAKTRAQDQIQSQMQSRTLQAKNKVGQVRNQVGDRLSAAQQQLSTEKERMAERGALAKQQTKQQARQQVQKVKGGMAKAVGKAKDAQAGVQASVRQHQAGVRQQFDNQITTGRESAAQLQRRAKDNFANASQGARSNINRSQMEYSNNARSMINTSQATVRNAGRIQSNNIGNAVASLPKKYSPSMQASAAASAGALREGRKAKQRLQQSYSPHIPHPAVLPQQHSTFARDNKNNRDKSRGNNQRPPRNPSPSPRSPYNNF